ncbi:MAG: HAMP domain-containing histidine kinase [Chloroflexi bacterium]|nr:HAMP domain-containing histidine kinase [Chloroflexota bacterium]
MIFFKSLRVRLITSLVLIVFITLAAAGLTLFALFRGYRQDLTTANLRQVAAPIYYNFTVPSTFTSTPRGGERLKHELLAYIRAQRQETGVYILFLDSRGRVIEDFVPDSNPFAGEIFFVPSPPERGPNFDELPEGSYTTGAGETFLYVTVAMPPQVRKQETGINAIVVALPESAGPDVYRDLRQRLIFAGIIGSVTALLAGLLMWLSLYRPLARVTGGIRAVARGDYHQRVPVSGPSEVQALARDVNAMADSVEGSQRTLREFLANVSHELKTPLTSIRGFNQAMLDGTLETPEERARAARVIDAESRRLLHLVGELMDLSRIESGQQKMQIANVRVSELLSHVGDVFALRAEESRITLDVRSATPDVVLADFDRIEQVVGNLIDNAFRHTAEGGRIDVGSRASRPGYTEIYVSDEGAGIAAEDLPHVFDRFYRSADETAGSGAGLGLAISREIVRAHGGDIRAQSPEAGGSVFSFTVPLAPAGQPDALPRSRPAEPPREIREARG